MSIKRYDLCHIGSGIHAMMDDSDGEFVKYEDYAESERYGRQADITIENLERKVERLASESEERRQFILNGVEFGYIRLPDEDTSDSAKATYERCLSVGKYEPCQKCNDTGMTDSGGTQPWGEPIEIECDCLAAQLRQEAK